MSRRVFTRVFICLIAVCLITGLYGLTARAQDEPSRSAKAYEEEYTCVGGMCYYTGRQYTSQYDLLMGNIFPNVTIQYATPDWGGMLTGSASSYSRGSATGGLFTGPVFQFPVSGLSYYLGSMGAPKYETAQSYSPWTGSMSYANIYQGLGFQGAGFELGPFRNIWGGGSGGFYPGGSGGFYPGGSSGFYPGGSVWGYPWGGISGYPSSSGPGGTWPTRIY